MPIQDVLGLKFLVVIIFRVLVYWGHNPHEFRVLMNNLFNSKLHGQMTYPSNQNK
jgi:hypothetical protein